MRRELHSLILAKRAKMIKGDSGGVLGLIDDIARMYQQIERIFNIAEVSWEIWGSLRRDNEKLSAVDDAILGLREQMMIWQNHEDNIYNVLIPQIREVEESLRTTAYSLPGKSHFDFDFSKWQIQSMLKDVKIFF